MKLTEEEKIFIRLFNDGYLEETVSEKLNLTEKEYELIYNKLFNFLDQ